MFTKTLLTLVTMSFVSFGFSDNRADYNYPARSYDGECSSPEPACPDDCRSSNQRIEDMQDRVITPDAGPRVCNGVDVIITADFIYWKSREDGLAFATTGTTNLQGIALVNANRGSVLRPNFNWDPGFKVGLGLNFNHDGWDLYAQYTWLRSNPSRKEISIDLASLSTTNTLRNTWVLKGLDNDQELLFASGNWNMHFNVIDAELGRNYYISKYLTLRPFIGFKGTWQDDNYTVRYQQSFLQLGPPLLINPLFRMRNNIDYWGFGIRFGSNNAWYFIRNFCLFSDWALSALWSNYDMRRKDFVTPVFDELENVFLERNQSWDWYSIKAVLELAIGLRYDVWWSNDDYHFAISAGWEEQIWFSHNQHYSVIEEAAHGDMVLQGLTLKARFDF